MSLKAGSFSAVKAAKCNDPVSKRWFHRLDCYFHYAEAERKIKERTELPTVMAGISGPAYWGCRSSPMGGCALGASLLSAYVHQGFVLWHSLE